jgi:membrane-bound lytic murein transglycosylase D
MTFSVRERNARKGNQVKTLLFLFVTLAITQFAWADEMLSSTVENSITTASASLPTNRLSGSMKEMRPAARSVNPGMERDLGKALELQASDVFAPEESSGNSGDFELKLPEESLPESDIPLTVNAKVDFFINYFQTAGRKDFAKWLSRSERYIPMMKDILKKEGLPEDLVYLAMIESGFSPRARSSANAVGPWQFISGTGKRYSLRIDSWIDERRDPIKSTVAAALYLKELYCLFNKDWYLAAAGYNAGENKILRAIDIYNSRDFWQLAQGSYLKRETKDYVPKLLAAAIIAKDPASYGFADVAYLPPIEFDTVVIPSQTDLDVIASVTGVSSENLRELNPELKRWSTPPDYPNYELKLPKGKKEIFLQEYAKIPEVKRFEEKITYMRYRAGRKDSIASISRRFGVSPEEIAELNHLDKSSRLRGRVLILPQRTDSVSASSETRHVVARHSRKSRKAFVKYYTVKHGDTLRAVARRFNVSAKILVVWNHLKGRMSLSPGKRIIVAKFIEKNGSMIRQGEING